MRKKILLGMIGFCLLCIAAMGVAQGNEPSGRPLEYQEQIEAVREIQKKAVVPENNAQLQVLRAQLDVNNYFRIFTHLSLEKGWKLDYIYIADGLGSYPVLLAYQAGQEIDVNHIYQRNNIPGGLLTAQRAQEYLSHIQTDGTEDGYWQWIVLSIIGPQFALGWHANYNDREIVTTRQGIDQIISRKEQPFYHLEPHQIEAAGGIEPRPVVTLEKERVLVRLVVFTKWGGFLEEKYFLTNQFPYRITKTEQTILVNYRCGIMF